MKRLSICVILSCLGSCSQASGQSGIITTVAGDGTQGFFGDGGPATAALLNHPYGVVVDASGNLFIADTSNNRIRKVSVSGIITTVAGGGNAYPGDGGPATSASLNGPFGVAVDASGNLFIADTSNNRIRKVSVSGIVTTVAGNGTRGFSGDGGPATAAELYFPEGVAVDASGNLFIADTSNNRIRKVSVSGIITTVAGDGNFGFSGDGVPATTAELYIPDGVAVDNSGNLFIADAGNNRIRKVSASGIITTVAGNGPSCNVFPCGSFAGDGGPATAASLIYPFCVAVDASGDLFIADSGNNRIREVSDSGIITTVAGGGSSFPGDGGPATSAALNQPGGAAVGASGNLFIANTNNNRIREVSASGAATGNPASQTITFGGLSNVTLGAGSFTIGATASSGLAVTFASTTASVCTVSGSTVTIVAVGTCSIAASQAGNANYAAATPVTQSFTVNATLQTITFGALSNVTLGVAPFTVSAMASSGLAVTFASTTASVCAMSGSIVTVVTAGTCSIMASQPGNANYAAATPVTQSFEVSAILTTLYSFCSQGGCADGATPTAGLVQGTDGNFYGTTALGGANGVDGTVFKITPGGTLTTLYSFCSQSGCADGATPTAGLVQGTDGNFYGTTVGGGANACPNGGYNVGCGTVFQITPSGTLTTLYSFCSQSGCTDGSGPSGLIQATDGNFYGTTVGGGGGAKNGTVFKVTPSGTLTTLYSFCSLSGCTDGSGPSGLIQATEGNFYGTTGGGGGGAKNGTVFKITPGGTLATLYNFCSQSGCPDGSNPEAGLVQGTDGNFYGTTANGRAGGTVFKITPSGTLTTLHIFCTQGTPVAFCADGASPVAALVQGTDGNFYGTTALTVFKITPSGLLTTLYNFCPQGGCEYTGISALIQANNGDFYGTTGFGGFDNTGTIFSLSVGTMPPANLPSPVISGLSPDSVTAGGAAFTLTANGSGFVNGGSIFEWNGSAVATSYISANQLSATIPASLIASQGTVSITVLNTGASASNAVAFTINPPPLVISGLSPNSAIAGGATFVLTVNGTGFVSGSNVEWNGSALATSFVNANHLSAIIPAKLIASPRSAIVTVINTGAGASNGVTFVIFSPGPNLQTISHIADGGGWRTSIILVNTDTVPAQYTVSFWNDLGASYVPPLAAGATSGSLPVGGSTIIETADTASALSEGWAEVTSSQSIGGTAIFRYDPWSQEAAVPLLVSGGVKLEIPYQVGNGLALGIALANLSATQTANIREVIRDQNGNQLASRTLTLAALNHTAFNPTFPSGIAGGGVVEYDSNVNILALGIRSAPEGGGLAFTSLDAVLPLAASTKTISHIADGGGWRSSIILVNTDTVPALYTVSFWNDSGASYVPPLASGTTSGSLPVGGSTIIETADTASALSEGWAEVTSIQSIGGTAIFRYDPWSQEAAVPLLASGGVKLEVPYQVGNGLALGIALANPSATQTANITEVIRDQNGNQLASRTLTLPALNHTAFNPTFPSGLTGGGVVEYDSNVNIFALGIRSAPEGGGLAFTSVRAAYK